MHQTIAYSDPCTRENERKAFPAVVYVAKYVDKTDQIAFYSSLSVPTLLLLVFVLLVTSLVSDQNS